MRARHLASSTASLLLALALAACGGGGTTSDAATGNDTGSATDTGGGASDVQPGNDATVTDTGGALTDVPTPPTDTPTPSDVPPTTSPLWSFFPPGTAWDRDVSGAAVDSESAAAIAFLDGAGGFGAGRMQIDFSIEVLEANASTPMRTFETTDDFYEPDCDHVPVPVPAVGNIEGEDGYACLGDGDCHLIVVHRGMNRLYEMWRANITGSTFRGGCMAVWDLTRRYNDTGRGAQCTSADAAGFPIAPLLFTADEVAAGSINHAIRFILPNPRMRRGFYVAPATHAGGPSGPMTAPPYGARLRLRADYPLASLPNEGARVVARAMQRYGMLLADGGNIALTARSDRYTTAKWDGLLGPRDLQAIRVTDFQMIEAGPRVRVTNDCVRAP